ncbi:hypothetical protein GCM10023172_19770 [Hymenobacter ginsengisoli]|uniref:Uncharacterized protein n=1 Tax=Hymenobacter ginsengisoli TaxID=1051626 RepID=A0ABP8QAE2_9BACT|nr:hypothetical protein [Hymenobacter sp. BT559]
MAIDEKRKVAYRKILYNFLIGIKAPEIPNDTSAIATGRYAALVAYALHNFALSLANDFVNFDEEAFWRGIASWDAHYPEVGFSNIRKMFEWDLAED